MVLVAVALLVFRKRIPSFFKKPFSEERQNIGDGLNVKQFIKTYRSALLSNYSYNDIKKMTNGFKEKLGTGGYGNVYKGKFPDGRLVAVKVLEKTSNFSDNFINEVATIGRIHHINIINLLGFCCDGSTRALIYEYMPNGSLGDLLSREKENLSLKPARLFEIALGVAHAIEYLHNGCELRILHLDIKPQNVLLDPDFNPKVSDFGLAKAHSRNRSVVTMTGPRGTIGYIAPEIFMRNLGNPSHKSDVYSYGMLLLEMIGEKKHLKPTETTSGSNTTEAYFPDWIYDKLIQPEKDDFVEEEDDCIARKMIIVGLWCIQINPKDRPSMTRVVEMLSSASAEAIEMPPKPLFSSPPQLQTQNEIISFDSITSELPLQHDSQEL